MVRDNAIPRVPGFVATPMAHLPRGPLQMLLRRLGRRIAGSHPAILDRLGAYAGHRFLIQPTDLPLVFMLHPARADRMIEVVGAGATTRWDSRIAGPIAALLGLMHGLYDGDGLFFSRDLAVEGDIEGVLALRNALDDAELDLFTEIFYALGAPGRLMLPALRAPVRDLAQRTGIAFLRNEEPL